MTEQEKEIDRVIKYIRSCRNAGIDTTITIDKSKNHFILNALEEFLKYRSIGTVTECREAMEKQGAKKPIKKTDRYTDVVEHYYCPACGEYFGQAGIHNVILFRKPKYCDCGQRLNWERDTE